MTRVFCSWKEKESEERENYETRKLKKFRHKGWGSGPGTTEYLTYLTPTIIYERVTSCTFHILQIQ